MSEDLTGPGRLDPAQALKPITTTRCPSVETLFRGALVMGSDGEFSGAQVLDELVRGAEIAEVGRDLRIRSQPGMEVIDGSGHLLMPGAINGHFHSPVNLLKGTLDSLPLELFMLFEVPALDTTASAEAAYVRTMIGAVEMLKLGITAVQDDAFPPGPERHRD